MKTTRKIALTLTMVLAFSLALVGCGQATDYTKNFSGDWKLESVTSDGETVNGDDLAMLEAMGMTFGLTLNEDGTVQLVVLGETSEGTWKAKSATEAEVTIDGSTVVATLADDKLSLDSSGDAMVFVRGKADTASTNVSSTTSTSSSSDETEIPMNETIVDDELITVTLTAKFQDWTGAVGYKFTAVNNSDQDFSLTYVSDSFSVNGKMASPYLFTPINAGMSADDRIEFETDKVASPDDLVNVKGSLELCEKDTYNEIRQYPIAIA